MANIKTGIVLEGGGMRGMYTCGILDVLMENQAIQRHPLTVEDGQLLQRVVCLPPGSHPL